MQLRQKFRNFMDQESERISGTRYLLPKSKLMAFLIVSEDNGRGGLSNQRRENPIKC